MFITQIKSLIKKRKERKKVEDCRENLWNEIQLKGAKRHKQTQEQNKKEWASLAGLCQKTQTVASPPREGEPAGTGVGLLCKRGTS